MEVNGRDDARNLRRDVDTLERVNRADGRQLRRPSFMRASSADTAVGFGAKAAS